MIALTLLATLTLAPGSRTDADGWIYLKLSGSPREIGRQYGRLASKEINDAHRALRGVMKNSTGKEWTYFRNTAKQLFWQKIDTEYQEEIEGQAESLKAAGLPYDALDVLAFNAYIEIEGYYLPWSRKNNSVATRESCSAFVAVGKATKGGAVVMAHNLWWDYIMGQRFNVMLDIKPDKGNRIMMDALAGFIHSGSDFGMNSAGMLLTETTISGFTGFDPNGIPEFMRMRKALQYSNNLDEMVSIFKKGNNGGYANTWLMADTRKGEIGRLQLGLKNVVFDRKKDGSYYGANFPEDEKLRKEECPGYWFDPKNNCEMRKAKWSELVSKNEGKIDAEMGKQFLATGILNSKSAFGGGAVNAKVATTDNVLSWNMWARMGFSDGIAMSFSKARGANRVAQEFLRDVDARPWRLLGSR